MSEPAEEMRRKLGALRLERVETAAPPPHRWRRRALAAVALVALGVVALRLARGAPVVEVATASVPQGSAVAVLSGAGYVVSADRYIAIGVRVGGRIDRYFVEEGDHVKAGDALVQLDARDYEAAVRRAEANVAVAKATAALKRKQVARARALGHQGVMSHDELDLREAEASTADATVQQAEADLATARISLDYTTLRAPTSGVILAKLKEVGEIAVPGGFSGSGDLIRIANLEDLRGQVDVTESELAKVHLSQQAEVVPDAYPDRRYTAHVIKLYPQIDRQKGTLRVEVQIEHPDEFLWPDMSARITFQDPLPAPSGDPGVLIPKSAVRGTPADQFAWVVDDAHVRRTRITLGKEIGDQVQVTSGLKGAERVVVGDPPPLHDGARVITNPGR